MKGVQTSGGVRVCGLINPCVSQDCEERVCGKEYTEDVRTTWGRNWKEMRRHRIKSEKWRIIIMEKVIS